jgi:hypothetical protein
VTKTIFKLNFYFYYSRYIWYWWWKKYQQKGTSNKTVRYMVKWIQTLHFSPIKWINLIFICILSPNYYFTITCHFHAIHCPITNLINQRVLMVNLFAKILSHFQRKCYKIFWPVNKISQVYKFSPLHEKYLKLINQLCKHQFFSSVNDGLTGCSIFSNNNF